MGKLALANIRLFNLIKTEVDVKRSEKKDFVSKLKDEFSNSVIVKSSENLIGKIKKVIITNGNHNTLFGAISKKENKKDFAA